nr:hypothetical protein [uncultured Acetatifactor sp.]
MGNMKREFIINDLTVQDFIIHEGREILLMETDETGKSELRVRLTSDDNLCIANMDKKKTDILFFQPGKAKSLFKRVDHMIFERQQGNHWKLHMIEMKGSVGQEKWVEIKGKFRASYLVAQAIAGILDMEISETVMYTTFERVEFTRSATLPTARHGRLGIPQIRMKEEWDGIRFGLNIGKHIPFGHIPIKMERNKDGVLAGKQEI